MRLASISRSSFYREPTAETEATLRLMRLIDEQFLEYAAVRLAATCRRSLTHQACGLVEPPNAAQQHMNAPTIAIAHASRSNL